VLLRELEEGAKRHRRASLKRLALSIGLVYAYVALLAVFSQPLSGTRDLSGFFVPMSGAGCMLVIIWIVASSKAWNRRWGLHCPQCQKLISDGTNSGPWSYCGHCEEKLADDIEDEPFPSFTGGSTFGEGHSLTDNAEHLDELRRRLMEDFGVAWNDDQ
jgi:hypothetical protein